MPKTRSLPAGAVVVAALALLAVLLVATTLRRPELATYAPTVADPREVEEGEVGPALFTVDASDPERWIFFDFSRGTILGAPDAVGWDLAFRRFEILVNGGEGFEGSGGALDLGAVAFDSVGTVPADGYVETVALRDSANAALADWYDYGFASHLLLPKARVYALRTADGRYAKMEILSYYCPGALPGCLTFRYVYQGSGSREVGGGRAAVSAGGPPGSVPESPPPR